MVRGGLETRCGWVFVGKRCGPINACDRGHGLGRSAGTVPRWIGRGCRWAFVTVGPDYVAFYSVIPRILGEVASKRTAGGLMIQRTLAHVHWCIVTVFRVREVVDEHTRIRYICSLNHAEAGVD